MEKAIILLACLLLLCSFAACGRNGTENREDETLFLAVCTADKALALAKKTNAVIFDMVKHLA